MNGKNRKAMVDVGILITLMFTTALVFLTSSSVVAEPSEIIVIAHGKENALNANLAGDKPWKWYEAGDCPPIIMAKKTGAGAVVAAGVATSFEDIEDAPEFGRWNDARPDRESNPYPHLDILLDSAFQWMVPGATEVLWYEGYGVNYNATNCSNLIEALENLGYTITSDSTEPITADLLAPYDILVIPQLRIDPPAADINTIKTFVEGGKGLLIAEGSDFQDANYYSVQNKILLALENELSMEEQLVFQSDEMEDPVNNYQSSGDKPIVDVDTSTEIGAAYQAATVETTLGLYRPCTLAPPTLYGVAISIVETEPTPSDKIDNGFRPTLATASPGENITTLVKISNIGKVDDDYTISASDDLGWQIDVSPATLTVPAGEGRNATIKITVDPIIEEKVQNLVRITVRGTDVEDWIVLSTAPYLPLEELPYSLYKGDEYFYMFSTPSLIIESPAQPIIIGTETADTLEETYSTVDDPVHPAPPPMPFGQREFPIAAAAAEVENGRVVVYGPFASFRSAPTNHFTLEHLRLKELGPRIIGWLVNYEDPAQHRILFYCTEGAFHDEARIAEWLDYLWTQGYTVHTFTDGITSERLSLYSVLIVPTPERELTDDEITAIKDWVHAGGGIFLGAQADYGMYSKPFYVNPILEAIGAGITTQDDQITDNDQQARWAWEPRAYLVDHPIWYAPYAVSIKAMPETLSVIGGESEDFTIEIKNEGAEADNYRIEVTSEENWSFELEREEVSLASGQIENVKITVTSPSVEELSKDDFTVVVRGTRGSDTGGFRLVAEPGEPTPGKEPSEMPWATIGGIIVIVIIAAVVFLVLKRR